MAKKVDPDELIDTNEVALVLGLASRNAVNVYRGRYIDFPEPVVQRGKCLLWHRPDVVRWARSRRVGSPARDEVR
jgi:glutathione-regulated potassium-efflux system ancillary protein KefG